MIIAIDFDGTIVTNKYPNIGEPNWGVINTIKSHQLKGDKIILWTCRNSDRLVAAVEYCKEYLDLHFDAINENLDEIKVIWGNDTRKVYADEYWDDKAVRI
jgi:hypothetical protein